MSCINKYQLLQSKTEHIQYAVSYTHLDVYKRQMKEGPQNWELSLIKPFIETGLGLEENIIPSLEENEFPFRHIILVAATAVKRG